MAKKYSSLYAFPADNPAGPASYKGPTGERAMSVGAVARVSGAIANGDVVYLRGGLIPGEVIVGVDIAHSADANITAANLVLRPTDGSADVTLVAASAALDGAVNTSIEFAAMAGNIVPNDGKAYELCWIIGAAGADAVHTHVVRSVVPSP